MTNRLWDTLAEASSVIVDESGQPINHAPKDGADSCIPDCWFCERGVPVRRLKRVETEDGAILVGAD